MAYERKFFHYDSDSITLLNDLTDLAENATFELLRHGGCGAGTLTLSDPWSLRDRVTLGHYIAFEYREGTDGNRWYFGRVESLDSDSPSRVTLSLYGMWTELNEVYPGGLHPTGDRAPHLYARADYFGVNQHLDRDRDVQSWDVVNQPEQVLYLLYHQYIAAATNVDYGVVEIPGQQVDLESVLFRGEETAATIIRSLAAMMNFASFGVDADKNFFVMRKRSSIIHSYKEGVDCVTLDVTTDLSLTYNRLLLTGGNIYFAEQVGNFRSMVTFRQPDSISRYGERQIRVYLPWIRRDNDATQFAKEFFRVYANPTKRYTLQDNGNAVVMLKPWDGQIRLRDKDNNELVVSQFDRIECSFEHRPTFRIVLGPEDVQLPVPNELQRWEITPMRDGNFPVSLSSLGTHTGIDGSSLASGVQSFSDVEPDSLPSLSFSW